MGRLKTLRRRRQVYQRRSAGQHTFQIVTTAQNALASMHICGIKRSVCNTCKVTWCSCPVNNFAILGVNENKRTINVLYHCWGHKQVRSTFPYREPANKICGLVTGLTSWVILMMGQLNKDTTQRKRHSPCWTSNCLMILFFFLSLRVIDIFFLFIA